MTGLRELLGESALAPGDLEIPQIAVRISAAALFGVLVSLLYVISRRAPERTKGFPQTLVLLAPLIAMVTMAVGTNVAAAFTLVGTLAIVRFRTPVRDSRDTVFVIFSVAEGMAMGGFHIEVASIGLLVTGATILITRQVSSRTTRGDIEPLEGEVTLLRFSVTPADAGLREALQVIERHAPEYQILRSNVRGNAERLQVALRIERKDVASLLNLQQELLRLPELKSISLDSNLKQA